MYSAKSNAAKPADASWHEFRKRARREAFSPEEFSDAERVRFNLDSDDRLSPAGITGEANPQSYDGSDPGGIDPDPPTYDPDDDPVR